MTLELSGRRILLVEDEYFQASELSTALRRAGAIVLGPVGDLERARILAAKNPDAAILDIKLHSTFVYPLADQLIAHSAPVLFVTGFERASIPARYRETPCFEKPVNMREIVSTLASVIAAKNRAPVLGETQLD